MENLQFISSRCNGRKEQGNTYKMPFCHIINMIFFCGRLATGNSISQNTKGQIVAKKSFTLQNKVRPKLNVGVDEESDCRKY